MSTFIAMLLSALLFSGTVTAAKWRSCASAPIRTTCRLVAPTPASEDFTSSWQT